MSSVPFGITSLASLGFVRRAVLYLDALLNLNMV